MERLLFFTPVLPGVTGQGTAIRAGVALELLAEKYEVTVVHVDQWTGDPKIQDHAWPRTKAAAFHHVPAPVAPDAAENLVRQHLSQSKFDAVYVFRLIAAPFALRVMGLLSPPSIPNALDLDDDECARTEKFLALRETGGDPVRERSELNRQQGFVRLMLVRFERCLLASSEERDGIAARYPGRKFGVLPNVVRVPEQAPALAGRPRGSMLFLGTLDYIPNEDAALYFANAILPLLLAARNESGPTPELRIVGIKTPPSIEKLRGREGLTVVGTVKDVAPEYRRARMLVVPLRAASGTRIKILEAFGFGTPVVSTTMGASGLEVRHGTHLLLADTPEEFAAACLRLMEDDDLAEALAANAYAWLSERHSLDAARQVLHGLYA